MTDTAFRPDPVAPDDVRTHADAISTADDAQPWPAAFRALVEKRHTLLLQGPMGGFFGELASLLAQHGQQITKVHFNGGDEVFWCHRDALRFTGRLDELGTWLRALIGGRKIDAMVLFGQMRPIHRVARDVARELGTTGTDG